MRVLLTGASGFVGRWLDAELREAGHEVIGTPPSRELNLLDDRAIARFIDEGQPSAIAHLAAISFGPDATRDPEQAFRVNEGGTASVLRAAARLGAGTPVLVTSSSDVYGHPRPEDLPLREDSPRLARSVYGRSKIAQEDAAVRAASQHGLTLTITRSFNHTGPGQRRDFVAPALAERIERARAAGDPRIPVGNLDARRDIGDVRDVVRAYRLLLELAFQATPRDPTVVNVCTGRSIAIRELVDRLAALAGIAITPIIDPGLIRPDDPPELVGDHSRLVELTGWQPTIDIGSTLSDVLDDVRAHPRPAF